MVQAWVMNGMLCGLDPRLWCWFGGLGVEVTLQIKIKSQHSTVQSR